MKKILILAIFILLVGCGDSKPDLSIKINGDVIYYKGAISKQSYKIFQDTMEANSNKVFSKLIINSGGGDTVFGRKIGKFVFENKLDVEVETLCFSSCANYIFTAGKNKIIQKDAFVGWHGNEYQSFILGPIENKTASQYHRSGIEKIIKEAVKESNFSEEKINTFIDGAFKQSVSSMKDEAKFFEDIGVNMFVSLLGLESQLTKNKGGFTYSLSDMEIFGVKNVTYLGSGAYPENVEDTMFVYKIQEKDKETIKQILDPDSL